MTPNEQKAARLALVNHLRADFGDGEARAALADWEREYGDPDFGDFLDVSLHDLLKHGGSWETARGYKMFRGEFTPLLFGRASLYGVNWTCSGQNPPAGESLDDRTIPPAPTVPMRPGLMKVTAYLYNAGYQGLSSFTKGGLLCQVCCAVDWWRLNGNAVLAVSPVQTVLDLSFRPNRVKRRSQGRGEHRHAWFNAAEKPDARFAPTTNACRLPEDVFLLLEGRNGRAARYDSEAGALRALSDAMIKLASGAGHAGRFSQPDRPVGQDP